MSYLGQHISKHALFKKAGNLILAEHTGKNSLDLSFYENNTGCPRPELSAFAAAALAACRDGRFNYGDEISIICNGSTAFVTCSTAESATIKCTCEKVFEGKISENLLQ